MRKFLIVSMVVVLSSLIMGAGCFISNLPPILTSDPVTTATVGVLYTYDVEATDPDDDVLTYYLTAYPNGMKINPATGLIKWIPAIEGDYTVTVKVSDGDLDIYQDFTIVVSVDEPVIPNKPPEIISSAITSGKVGVVYTYDVNATDPEGDTLTYYLTEKPLGMSIFATTGIIKWTPTDAGLFAVGVKVSDPDGLFDVQGFNITVAAADEPEPVPDPVVLVGIAVEPETMELVKRKSETIVVTACYELRGYEEILDPEKCLFLTSNSKVATVDKDGKVTAKGVGTTNILVSYEGKFATLGVTVIYKPMEIKVDMPLFEEGIEKGFRLEIIANDDKDEMVKFYFTLPEGIVEVEYEGETVVPPTEGDYTMEWYLSDGPWMDLTDPEEGIATFDEKTGEVVIGAEGGNSLFDEYQFFKATFSEKGVYETTVEVWTITEEEKDELLCSKVITATVLPDIPEH